MRLLPAALAGGLRWPLRAPMISPLCAHDDCFDYEGVYALCVRDKHVERLLEMSR